MPQLVGKSSYAKLLSQLVWGIAMNLEAQAEAYVDANTEQTKLASLRFSGLNDDSILADPGELDRMVMRHVLAARQHSHGQQYYCLVSDKVSGVGPALENAIISYPDNTAVLCMPQAGWISKGGLRACWICNRCLSAFGVPCIEFF